MSWNQWPSAAVQPPSVVTATAPALINPAPTVLPPGLPYTADQWSQMQQQNWQQWAQWQQQYQQWHQQYGAEYQKSISALTAQQAVIAAPNLGLPPPLPMETHAQPPPLPQDEVPKPAPPLPHIPQYSTQPPPSNKYSAPPPNFGNLLLKRPLPQTDNFANNAKRQMLTKQQQQQGWKSNAQNVDELSEPEKKFDKQFAEWEAQFNKWKDQNSGHPDKQQYREYEKKWEQWRQQLLERREAMRKKRLALATGGNKIIPNQNFSVPPPVQNQQKPGLLPHPNELPSKDALLPTPTLFNKPPPDMNNEPLKFKRTEQDVQQHEEGGNLSFLTTTKIDGIPGLDLVKDDGDAEIAEESHVASQKGPDLDAISKGINNILGDQKLMSMLSMVSQNHNFNQNSNAFSHQDQSNLSSDDMKVEPYQSEIVQNIDDQTRSSFTIGDADFYRTPQMNRNFENEFDKGQMNERFENNYHNSQLNNRFGRNQDCFDEKPPQLMGRNFEENNFLIGRSRPGMQNFENQERNSFNYPRDVNKSFGFSDNLNMQKSNREEFGAQNNFGSRLNRDGQNFRENQLINNDRNRLQQFNRDNMNLGNNNNNRFVPNNRNLSQNNFEESGNDDFQQSWNDNFTRTNVRLNDENGSNAFRNGRFEAQRIQEFENRSKPFESEMRDGNFGVFRDQYAAPPPPSLLDLKIENPNILQKGSLIDTPEPPQFNKEDCSNDYESNEPPPLEDIWKPTNVIDYEHKSVQQQVEIDILVEPFRMFDYRHKPLRRIPFPDRPNWLSDAVRMIPEFDPPLIRNSLIDRQRSFKDDRLRYGRYAAAALRFSPPSKIDFRGRIAYPEDDWRRNRSRSPPPPRFDRGEKESNDWRSERDVDKKRYTREWENDDKNFERESFSKRNESIFPLKENDEKKNNNVTLIEDVINPPGRFTRPPRIVIILRGPPGSGKTYLAKLIKDKEVENGGSAPRILSLDDYFMIEHEKETVEDGKRIKVKEMIYEFEAEMEESYRMSLMRSFKKTITDGYFPFIIVDNVNDKVRHFGEMWSFAKQNGFQVYICQLDLDVQNCVRRNIHKRTEEEIRKCVSGWETTPSHHPILDASFLTQEETIPDVEMEEINSPASEIDENEEDVEDRLDRSKWDNFDCSINNLARLDGVNKPLRPSRTMEEYLQLDDWEHNKPSKPGQKRVRWADLEERKQQEKMRAIGFVVGQTNWDRMMDPTKGESALTQTKYIEKVRRNRY